jgi:hypothetical protein
MLAAAMSLSSSLNPAQAERIGVYVMAGIVGLLVMGIVSFAKQIRKERKAGKDAA